MNKPKKKPTAKKAPAKPRVKPQKAAQVTPESINDLLPASYNAKVRQISDAAREGLTRSLAKYGDLSGITFNLETGNLVTGHQRLDALKAKWGNGLWFHGEHSPDGGMLQAPDGQRYPVRYVTLTEAEEKAANLAANSTDIAGEFLWEGVEEMLLEIQGAGLDLLDTGFLEGTIADLFKEDAPKPKATVTEHKCPQCGYSEASADKAAKPKAKEGRK